MTKDEEVMGLRANLYLLAAVVIWLGAVFKITLVERFKRDHNILPDLSEVSPP